jgi:pyruvate formate lyase activating enzyme
MAVVFNIQRYSIHDGPGIRTVVFLKGCSLVCQWCSNPESQSNRPEIEFIHSLCRQCGSCLEACPLGAIHPDLWVKPVEKIDREICDRCGLCLQACPGSALRWMGREQSAEEVFDLVQHDAAYYRRSGGGVTLSGGEPLLQAGFCQELLQRCYNANVQTALETAGNVSWKAFEKVLPYTDLFLFDLKHLDPAAHMRLTGASNKQIIANLERLSECGAEIILRLPLIPGANTELAHLRSLAEWSRTLELVEIHLMPFHQFGKDKYSRIGKAYSLASQPAMRDTPQGLEILQDAVDIFSACHPKVLVGG